MPPSSKPDWPLAAVRQGDAAAVAAWLNNGGDIEATLVKEDGFDTGDTLLMIASMNGHADLVDVLLRRGARSRRRALQRQAKHPRNSFGQSAGRNNTNARSKVPARLPSTGRATRTWTRA